MATFDLYAQEPSIDIGRLKSLADYVDLNSFFGFAGQADTVYDRQAISQGLRNIFKTTPGEAGPIFEPEFGSLLPLLLQEPFDEETAEKIRAASIQAAQRWETRIDIDFSLSRVDRLPDLPGYQVLLVYSIRKNGERSASRITLPLNGA